MWIRSVLCSLGFAAAAPALAQCPPTAVQEAVNVWATVSQGQPSAGAAARIDALADACQTDAYVLKVAALANGAMSANSRVPDDILAHGIKARKLSMMMRDVQPANEKAVSAQVGQNWIQIRLFGDNFDTDILRAYFVAQQRSGRLAPEGQPVASGESLRACRSWDRVDAQTISTIIRENLKSDLTAPLNVLDRLIAVCASRIDAGEDALMLGLRARALYQLLTDNPQRVGAKAMMEKLRKDSERFFKIHPNGDSVYWSTYDRDRLAAFSVEFDITTGNVPPRSDWFKARNTDSALVIGAIALALDDAWAIDDEAGIGGKYKTYRDLIAALHTEAASSGNAASAKKALALAARGQSDGSMRRAANKQRKGPPDFLWKWIDTPPQPQ